MLTWMYLATPVSDLLRASKLEEYSIFDLTLPWSGHQSIRNIFCFFEGCGRETIRTMLKSSRLWKVVLVHKAYVGLIFLEVRTFSIAAVFRHFIVLFRPTCDSVSRRGPNVQIHPWSHNNAIATTTQRLHHYHSLPES